MEAVLITIAVLASLGLTAAFILYFVSQKFKVYEDPKIGEVEEVLPGANCGGCGFAGCHAMAEALAKADDISGLVCPVGGSAVMSQVATILGKSVAESAPKVAVVRCAGCTVGESANRQKTLDYDGAKSCAIASTHFAGDTACSYGCLGLGDCVKVCQFNAIKVNEATGLAEVDEAKCVACGACAKACPKQIIEIRYKGRVVKDVARRVWVSCVNKDKGAVAMKACKASCIGCGKCAKVCKFEAITVENNVAHIDMEKCKACGLCMNECPKNAIVATFPAPPKPAPKPAAVEATGTAIPKPAEQPKPVEVPVQADKQQ
ncbi:MAG: RnfABCDGE type electron transport complex subunit B [Bacteroidales bacterium]|nr:RnfABCDGE type electron transport complex subunit B [Bacteroidales bacterium]